MSQTQTRHDTTRWRGIRWSTRRCDEGASSGEALHGVHLCFSRIRRSDKQQNVACYCRRGAPSLITTGCTSMLRSERLTEAGSHLRPPCNFAYPDGSQHECSTRSSRSLVQGYTTIFSIEILRNRCVMQIDHRAFPPQITGPSFSFSEVLLANRWNVGHSFATANSKSSELRLFASPLPSCPLGLTPGLGLAGLAADRSPVAPSLFSWGHTSPCTGVLSRTSRCSWKGADREHGTGGQG